MTTEYERVEQDGVASLVEEVRLLVELVTEHASPWLESVLAAGHNGENATETGEGHRTDGGATAGDGGWCPLCAVIAIVRGERPELAARLAEQAARLVALLRAVLADRWQAGYGPSGAPAHGGPAGDGQAGPAEAQAAAAAGKSRGPGQRRVQHIPVRRREAGAATDAEGR
ncbi:hypothetical protein [Haloechinothrix sp. LS1_15]|uniref:hypothetical protein n=1 Tax=Haloechinothrix sp. LS1_15 TaxID=2652248 RepID=UPI00294AC5C3|nr:hypothetical protein [Haloechinothrix sp. LS1_15]